MYTMIDIYLPIGLRQLGLDGRLRSAATAIKIDHSFCMRDQVISRLFGVHHKHVPIGLRQLDLNGRLRSAATAIKIEQSFCVKNHVIWCASQAATDHVCVFVCSITHKRKSMMYPPIGLRQLGLGGWLPAAIAIKIDHSFCMRNQVISRLFGVHHEHLPIGLRQLGLGGCLPAATALPVGVPAWRLHALPPSLETPEASTGGGVEEGTDRR
jgi:hypothetical protein